MKKLVKICCAALALFCAVVLALTAYGNKVLPDRYSTVDGRLDLGRLYSAASPSGAVRGAFSGDADGSLHYDVKLMKVFPVKTVTVSRAERKYLALGGELVGIKIRTQGVLVVGTEQFQSDDGKTADPAADAGIKKGDTLLTVDGMTLTGCDMLTRAIEDSGGRTLTLTADRNGTAKTFSLTPEKTAATGVYKGGLWIRDSTVGVGTLTYCDLETGTFGALGHGIYDADTASLLTVSDGELCAATVSSVKKGAPGTPGEITGLLGFNTIGEITENDEAGVYGTFGWLEGSPELYPVATANEVHTGEAQIVCTVADGEKQVYSAEIKKIEDSKNGTKNMTVKITDQTLLSLTGGIVQGMSGSPILQDGMLVGAVTHVFVGDPKCGYAIFAENMLEH